MSIYRTSGNARLLKWIPPNATTALDIGCGSGGMASSLNDYGIITDGITFSADEADLAEQHCRNVLTHNLENGLPDGLENKYQVLIASHVLEHIANPAPLMRSMRKILPQDGVILCAIPNMLFFKNRIKILLGKIEYQERGLMDYTHIRWYTRDSLIKQFSQSGFKLVEFHAEGNFPLGGLRKFLPSNLISAVDRISLRLAPSWIGWEYSFLFKHK